MKEEWKHMILVSKHPHHATLRGDHEQNISVSDEQYMEEIVFIFTGDEPVAEHSKLSKKWNRFRSGVNGLKSESD